MIRKKFDHLIKLMINYSLIIYLLFIVICHSDIGYNDETNQKSINKENVSNVYSSNKVLHRKPRAVRRGDYNYYQKGYDLNRLRYEKQRSYDAPRAKPYFHRVNEVYSYYLPPKFNAINGNVENFSDKYKNRRELYGPKGRPFSSGRAEDKFALTRRTAPTAVYQPISGVKGGTGSVSPYNSSYNTGYGYDRDPNRHRPDYRPYLPGTGSRVPIDNYPVPGGTGSKRNPIDNYPDTEIDNSLPDYQPYSPVAPVGSRVPIESYPGPGGIGSSRVPFVPEYPRSGGSSYSRESSVSSSSSGSSSLIPEPQTIIRGKNSTYPGFPGWQRVDYPGYYTIPYTGFRCASQPYYGYYADVTAGCQVFHVCQPDGREYSFLCPNGTLYHQKVQTCDWWYHVDCPSSSRFYYLNARIGVLPPIDSTLFRFPK